MIYIFMAVWTDHKNTLPHLSPLFLMGPHSLFNSSMVFPEISVCKRGLNWSWRNFMLFKLTNDVIPITCGWVLKQYSSKADFGIVVKDSVCVACLHHISDGLNLSPVFTPDCRFLLICTLWTNRWYFKWVCLCLSCERPGLSSKSQTQLLSRLGGWISG